MRLGFMASGRGSNAKAIIEACGSGTLAATPVLLISNNLNSGALNLAKEYNLQTFHLSGQTHPDSDELDSAITQTMIDNKIDLIVLAGYMKKIGGQLLSNYKDRIVNIHPSLLPAHGGQGMYGMNVHRAVIESGEKISGATIHLVNEDYDQGRILGQKTVQVSKQDTVESLAEKVIKVEHQLYPETLQKIISGEISL